MAKSLWGIYDNEPFMENPPLAIIGNPLRYRRRLSRGKYEYDYVTRKTKKRGKKMASKRKRVIRRKKSGRKGRKNPFPMAGVVANPRRRRRVRVHARRIRRHARRNPAILGGLGLPPLNQVLYAGAGFIAPPMVEGFINKYLPVEVTSSTIGRYAVKIASVLGLTFLAKKAIGASEARMVALGGASYVLVSAVNEFMPSLTMSAYRGGMINKYRGMQAYHSGTIGQYARPGLAANMPSLAAPIWGARNASAIDSTGGVNVISQRLRRFQ